jgi:hypothetical protein
LPSILIKKKLEGNLYIGQMMKKQVDEMKKIMELSKSPMLGGARNNMSGS